MQAYRSRPRGGELLILPALILTLAFAFSGAGATQNRGPRFEPGECLIPLGDWARDLRVECGRLVVPEVRERQDGRTVRLAVMILRATEPSGAPPVVFLHGGPGLNAITSRFPINAVRWGLTRHRDVVIFDQRGAGLSEPRLCPDVVERAVDIIDDRGAANAARACVASLKASGIERSAYNTAANVADAIDLRRSLGYDSWDIYGVSYGSRLAQELMRRDPAGIRAVVLDRPMPPGPRFYGETRLSFQKALERVFKGCTAQVGCSAAFPSVEQDFYALYEELTARPIDVAHGSGGSALGVRLDGARFVREIRNQFSGARLVSRIPLLLNELRRGDRARASSILVTAAIDRLHPTMQLVISYDVCGPALRSAEDAVRRQLPAALAPRSNSINCELWQERFADPSTYTPIQSDIPTLILTAEFDDRTPTEFGRLIAATLKQSYVYEMPGEVHAAEIVSDCHQSILLQFLENPRREPDASCVAAMPSIAFETTILDLRTFVFRLTAVGPQPTALAGSWRAVLPGPQSTVRFDLRAEDGRLTGTITPNSPAANAPANPVPILEGRIEHEALTFKAKSPDGGRTITFIGTLNGDELTFTRDVEVAPGADGGREGIFGVLGPSAFTARRVE